MIKLKNILTEKKELSKSIVDDIAKMTDRNDHNGARMELAKAMNNLKYQNIYQGIKMIADREGSMPRGLMKYRDDVDKKFIQLAKRTYDNYNDIYGAF